MTLPCGCLFPLPPTVQAAIQANVFSISGKSEEKHLMEALKTNPELMQQLVGDGTRGRLLF